MHIEDENIFNLFFADSGLFEKEGKLQINGFDCFNAEYVQCYCRLRGNLLLFINISAILLDDYNEPSINLIILNNFSIKLSEKSNQQEFCITLKNKIKLENYYFICDSIKERDEWIKSIYLTSFNFLRTLREALNNDLQKIQTIDNKNYNEDGETLNSDANKFYSSIIISCDNLLPLCNITSPSFYIKVFSRQHFSKKWHFLGCTEVIRSLSPQFLNSIPIIVKNISIIELKFELYHVIEKHFEIVLLMAYTYFNFGNIYKGTSEYRKKIFQIQMKNLQTNEFAGTLTFKIVDNHFMDKKKKSSSLNNLNLNLSDRNVFKISSFSSLELDDFKSSFEIEDKNKSTDLLFNEPIRKRFTFRLYDSNFIIEERMQDSKFAFLIPQILLKSHIEDEESIKKFIEEQSKLISKCDFYKKIYFFHDNNIKSNNIFINEMFTFMVNNSFRPSRCKKEAFLQFVPINFHKQTCQIYFEQKSSSIQIYSVGAYACHYLGFEKYNWKSLSLFSNEENLEVYETWGILKKLFQVCHNETKILKCLDDVINHFQKNNDDEIQDKIKIESLYKTIHCCSYNLIDLISKNEEESLINKLNSLIEDFNYAEENYLEPIDLIYLNIKACFVDIDDKISRKKFSLIEFEPCNHKLRSAISSLRRTVLACYLSSFSLLKKKEIDFLNQLKFRHFSLISQALTTLIIFISDNLENDSFMEHIARTGHVLILYETLLSCFSEETGMLEDMIYAVETISNDTEIVFIFDQDESSAKYTALMPDFDFNIDKIRLTFHLNKNYQDKYPDQLECKVKSLIFNVGVNQQASLPNNIFKKSLQEEVNKINFNKLKSYILEYFPEDYQSKNLLNELENEIESLKMKNIKILELACKIVRSLKGTIKATCCKSAKDRSSMSVTLEESRFAFQFLHLKQQIHPHLFKTMLDTLRKDGARIENVYKNIGTRKYAFNYLYLLTFPDELRPPLGTYSNAET